MIRPLLILSLIAAGAGAALALAQHENPEAETLALIKDARAVIQQHKTALYQIVEMDEGIVLRRNLSDKVCGINIDHFDNDWTRAKCEPQD